MKTQVSEPAERRKEVREGKKKKGEVKGKEEGYSINASA